MATNLTAQMLNSLDSEMLEELVLAYVNEIHAPMPRAQRIGVSGQIQKGVDVYANIPHYGSSGYQAKAYRKTTLTKRGLDKELSEAHKFDPPLDYYTVVTLNSRSAPLQEYARTLHLHGQPLRVSILALEDLAAACDSSPALMARLIAMALTPTHMSAIASNFAIPFSHPTSTSPGETDTSLPDGLRRVEDWVNNGMPQKALNELESLPVSSEFRSAATRIRCRALFTLLKFTEVVSIAETDLKGDAPNAAITILGALAAEELGNNSKADELASAAIAGMNASNRIDTLAGYVRFRARRPSTEIAELETFVSNHLGTLEPLAVALADSAAQLGQRERAAYWYTVARETKPTLTHAVQINALANSLSLAENSGNATEIEGIVEKLSHLEEATRELEATSLHYAVLVNLGFAYNALEKPQDAARAWDEALAASENQEDLWIRRCFLTDTGEVPPPAQEIAERHCFSRISRLAYASALISGSRSADAAPMVKEILDDEQASAKEISIAHVERLRIRATTDDIEEVALDALQLLEDSTDPLPLIGWLALRYRSLSPAVQKQIDARIDQIDPQTITDDQILASAIPIASGGFGEVLRQWLPRISSLAFNTDGSVKNDAAASVLAEIQGSTLDVSGQVTTLKRIIAKHPANSEAKLRLAEAYYQGGDRQEAFRVLEAAVADGSAAPIAVRNYAILALMLGHKRRAKSVILSAPLSKSENPRDYLALMQAKSALGIQDHDGEALALLSQGALTAQNASAMFAIGVNRRHRRPAQEVAFGTITHLLIPGKIDEPCFLTEKPRAPLPGVRMLDSVNHPWILQIMGAKVGTITTLSGSPFDGDTVTIVSVLGASDFVFREAVQQIHVSPQEQTGVQAISGTLEDQLAIAKQQLVTRHQAIAKRVDLAVQGGFPVSVMAEQFGTSPRAFLQSTESWVPRAHSGTSEDIKTDAKTLDSSKGFVFDAVTVLLLATIGAETFPTRMASLPRLTKQAAAQLLDWYFEERDQRRAVGHMNLDKEGNLFIQSSTVENRIELLKFWKRVRLIVQNCKIIESPTVEMSKEASELLKILGKPNMSTFNAAKHYGWTFISEEVNLRALAHVAANVRSASLHQLMIEGVDRSWITPAEAMTWIANLVDLGWGWIGFPADWIKHAMLIEDENERWRVAESLLGRMKLASPVEAVQALFGALAAVDAGLLPIADKTRYRKLVVDSFPPLPRDTRQRIAKLYRRTPLANSSTKPSSDLLDAWAKSAD